IKPQAPIVGTGMEYVNGKDSGAALICKHEGIVERVEAREVLVRRVSEVNGKEVQGDLDRYKLQKFIRSNAGTCINQRPIVKEGDRVTKGEVLADGPSMQDGEMALGQNVLVAFMTWEGYNYEDAIIMSERLVKDDVYTSIHIEEYESESRDTKLGPEEITRDIPNVGED
ncbi:DNA-directed RNA polymerase subunit beta, partial [Pseudoalteromonas sp. 2103]|nr:DNA-directed RNA polymerase subunit beta [Pseudoalteromonas sp. 2103]